jgi:glycosyltransferase involved in cell wall biosynthesis
MVAPLRIARGTQNKILEALAMGVPVVTSSVAAGGVDAVVGRDLLVADTAEATAAAVLEITGKANLRRQLSEAGRVRMLTHHAWPRSMQRLDAIIERCRRDFAGRSPQPQRITV